MFQGLHLGAPFSGPDGKASASGIGVVNNPLMIANTQKTILQAPFKMRPKPIWFISNSHRASEVFKKLTELDADPSFWKVPSILWSALKP